MIDWVGSLKMLSYSVLAYRFGQVSNPKMSSLAYHRASGASWRRFFFSGVGSGVRSVTTYAARNYGFVGLLFSMILPLLLHSLCTHKHVHLPREHHLGKIKTAELDIFLMGNFDISEKSREICTRDSRI